MIEVIRVAFAGLAANKLRSGLTILGLTIGVGSVIVLIAVGTGSSNAVKKQIDALGSNVLLVPRGRRSAGCSAAPTPPPPTRSPSPTRTRSQPLHRARRAQRLAGRQRQQRDADLRRHDLLAVELRRDDALLRGGPRLFDGARAFFTKKETDHSRVLVIGQTVVSIYSAVPTRSATPSRSTAPTSPWSASRTRRAPTGRPIRTTSRCRR